ncbi:hypothetical protein BDV96DRAFT_644042 [Lophiotrema nucula]|uniref:BTB domain-containing protein n=1 Tax=Lophiotrema nucula TaxID=690887 RepID=A0A6A5ZFH8_9PLEO|nr:hypothetical protein BDV96DRAFT_644042 [Lophiotrema nucula]
MPIQNERVATSNGKTDAHIRKQNAFSFFTMGTKLMYFQVGGTLSTPAEHFAVHQGLLDYHGFVIKGAPKHDLHGDLVYHLPNHEACTFRGLIELLYDRHLPTDDLIRVVKYPENWDYVEESDLAKEEAPLALSLAVEVFYLARHFSMHSIANKAMTFIFNHYKQHRTIPSTARIRQIFEKERCGKEELFVGLEDFIIDLCYKSDTTGDRDNLELLPPYFLAGIYFKNSELNWFKADKNVVPLKLSWYHWDCGGVTERGACGCEDIIE